MFGLGAANIKTEDNRNKFTPGANEDALTSENVFGVLWNTGFRFYISDHWSLRLDVTGLTYKAEKSKQAGSGNPVTTADKIFTNYDLGLGLNYTF